MLAAAGLAGNVAGTLQCSDAIAGTLSPSTRQWIDSQPAYHAYKKTIGQISTVGGYLAISGTVLRATRVSALSGVNAARETWKDLSPTQKRDMAEWLLGKPGRLAPLIARGNLSGYLRTKLIDRWFWDRLLEVVIGTLDNVEKVVVTTMVPDDSPWRSRSQR
jgi:sugar (pentulose or hexulose) kinase